MIHVYMYAIFTKTAGVIHHGARSKIDGLVERQDMGDRYRGETSMMYDTEEAMNTPYSGRCCQLMQRRSNRLLCA
jgi:hypothetical protein